MGGQRCFRHCLWLGLDELGCMLAIALTSFAPAAMATGAAAADSAAIASAAAAACAAEASALASAEAAGGHRTHEGWLMPAGGDGSRRCDVRLLPQARPVAPPSRVSTAPGPGLGRVVILTENDSDDSKTTVQILRK